MGKVWGWFKRAFAWVTHFFAWLKETLADPVSKMGSTTRLESLLLTLAAIVFAFVHPTQDITLGLLLAAATGNIALRTRAQP